MSFFINPCDIHSTCNNYPIPQQTGISSQTPPIQQNQQQTTQGQTSSSFSYIDPALTSSLQAMRLQWQALQMTQQPRIPTPEEQYVYNLKTFLSLFEQGNFDTINSFFSTGQYRAELHGFLESLGTQEVWKEPEMAMKLYTTFSFLRSQDFLEMRVRAIFESFLSFFADSDLLKALVLIKHVHQDAVDYKLQDQHFKIVIFTLWPKGKFYEAFTASEFLSPQTHLIVIQRLLDNPPYEFASNIAPQIEKFLLEIAKIDPERAFHRASTFAASNQLLSTPWKINLIAILALGPLWQKKEYTNIFDLIKSLSNNASVGRKVKDGVLYNCFFRFHKLGQQDIAKQIADLLSAESSERATAYHILQMNS